jgi:hypothetical protein
MLIACCLFRPLWYNLLTALHLRLVPVNTVLLMVAVQEAPDYPADLQSALVRVFD